MPDWKDSSDESDSELKIFFRRKVELKPELITRETLAAIKANQSIQFFDSCRNSLKLLCFHAIVKNQDFFLDKLQDSFNAKNPFLALNSENLGFLRDEIFNKRMKVVCDFSALLIDPAATEVNFVGCSDHLKCQLSNDNLWKVFHKASPNLRVLRCRGYKPPSILSQILKLERLQVIDIPEPLCKDKHLVLFASYFPTLQELRIRFKVKCATFKGVEALSRLRHFKVFIFSVNYMRNDDLRKQKTRELMEKCMHLMPWLRKLGLDTKTVSDYHFWECSHPIQVLQQPVEIGLEELMLKRDLACLEQHRLPNLKELYLYNPQGDVKVLGNLQGLRHLYVTKGATFDMVEKILRVVGTRLESIHLKSINGIQIDSVFRLCSNIQKVIIDSDLNKQIYSATTRLPSLTELKIFTGYSTNCSIDFQKLSELLQRSNNTLKVFEFPETMRWTSRETGFLTRLVEHKKIFQNLERVEIRAQSSSAYGETANYEDVIKLLLTSAKTCRKLTSIKCINESREDIYDLHLKEAVRRLSKPTNSFHCK